MMGEKLKKLIDDSGVNIDELAFKMGVSKQTIYNWFKKDSIESKYLEIASTIFEVPVSYFFENKSKKIAQSKSFDSGRFGNEVEEELRAHIETLKAQLDNQKQQYSYLQHVLDNVLVALKQNSGMGKLSANDRKRLLSLVEVPKDGSHLRVSKRPESADMAA
jgi:transcriptional regulator with XRE-family HTH domain